VALDIEKGVPGRLTRFPLSVSLGFLDLPQETNWDSVRLLGPDGRDWPVQVDRLSGDHVAPQDELAFLADFEGEHTRAHLYFSVGKEASSTTPAAEGGVTACFDKDGAPQFDNGLVRLQGGEFSRRGAGQDEWVTFLRGDGALRFDAYDFSGSKVLGWRTEVASNGPVRAVLRRVSSAVAATREDVRHPLVPAEVVQEWRVWRGRGECFVASQIRNVASGRDVLMVARGRSGLDATPGGRYTGNDYWTAVLKPWKTWTRSMSGGRKTQRAADGLVRDARLAEDWFDAHTDGPAQKPRVNVGLVFHTFSAKHRLWAGEQDGRFHVVVLLDMNWPRVPAGGKLWVGYWIVPHAGPPEEVRQFWRATREIDVIPGAIERLAPAPDRE